MKRPLTKKQNELLQDTLSFMAAELEAMTNSFKEVKYCPVHAQMYSSQIGMSSFFSLINPLELGNVSFFSSYCSLSIGVTQTMNPKTENF